MSTGGLLRFKSRNHPQQIAVNGVVEDVDDRGTTPELFDPLMARYRFTIDVAASPHNAKCERYYTKDDDGLAQSWAGERVWCNPPYSAKNLAAFVAKAWVEWRSETPPSVIVMLVPANRSEQEWWHEHIEPFRDRCGSPLRTEYLARRQRFIRHGAGHDEVKPNERPPFGCCLLIWQRPMVAKS